MDENLEEDGADSGGGDAGETTALYVPSVLRDVPCGVELDPLPPSPHRDYGTVTRTTETTQRGEEETSFSEGSDDSSLKQDTSQQQVNEGTNGVSRGESSD